MDFDGANVLSKKIVYQFLLTTGLLNKKFGVSNLAVIDVIYKEKAVRL